MPLCIPFFYYMSKEARTFIIIMITFLIILIDMCNEQESKPEDHKKEIQKDSTENKKMVGNLYI